MADNIAMDVQLPQTTHVPPSSNASESFWQKLAQQSRQSRRAHPRIHADISVHVLEVETKPIKLHCRDISFGGLQLRCCPETSQRLLQLKPGDQTAPNQSSVSALDGIARMNLEIRLVVDARVHKIQALARVAHYVYISGASTGQEIAIGFQFLGFNDQGKEILNKFIEENLVPAGY